MTVRDHEPITISDFRGLYDRGDEDTVPGNFFIKSQNHRFFPKGFRTREGCVQSDAFTNVRRMWIYKRIGEAQRLLVLVASGANGIIYDSTNPTVPILTINNMTDFSMVSAFNRAYITPHNGITGLPGERVYVYEGSGLARAAAGIAPTGGAIVVTDSAVSGHAEAGVHLYGVAFESDTGYISGIGYFAQHTNPGGFKLSFANIPTGPAGTVARHLFSTKKIQGTFDGDFTHQTYYFLPNGRIPDNVVTVYNNVVDFYDADLTDDASFLLDNLGVIPAGVGIGIYNGRLIVWGEDTNPSILRVSKAGEPESFSAVSGYATINPGDAGFGLKNCWEHNKLLVCQKSNRSYYTLDNTLDAAFWSTNNLLDASVGSEPHGVGLIEDYGKLLENIVIVAHKTGLRLYNGTFAPVHLSASIDWLWDRINKNAFYNVEVAIDATNRAIYVAVPLDNATSPSHIFYCNFDDGLDADSVRWDVWTFPHDPRTIVVDIDDLTKITMLKMGSLAGNIYRMDENQKTDYSHFIDSLAEFSLFPPDNDDSIMHFTGCRLRVKGEGFLKITARGFDDEDHDFEVVGNEIVLDPRPRRSIFSGFNFTSERATVKLHIENALEWYSVTKFSIYLAPLWEQRYGG